MAAFKILEPSIDKLTELAYITYQMLYYEDQFRRYKDSQDEKKALEYREHLSHWHKRNLEKVIK